MDSQNLVSGNGPLGEHDLRSALFRQVMQKSPDLISIVDRDYVYRMVNETYLERYKMTEEQMVGVPAPDIFGQNVFESKIKSHLDRCLDGETINYQDWFVYPDLGKRYMDVCYYPLPNDKNSAEHVAVVVRDITKHKHAEDSLRKSETCYRGIVEDQTELICRFLPDTTLTFVNQAYCRYFGKESDELVGHSFLPLIPEDEHEEVKALFASFNRENSTVTHEHPVLRPNGEIGWQQWTNRALFDRHGRLVEFQAVGRDITERKKMEETLRESEERYRKLLEYANDIILTFDINSGRVTSANCLAREKLGYSEQELFTTNYLSLIHPDDREAISAPFAQFLADGARSPNFPYKTRKADGTYIDLEQNAAVIFDGAGNPQSVIAIAQDVTERKKMEEELRLSEERHRRIIDASHDMTLVLDAGAEILFANRAWHEDISYTLDDLSEIDIFDTIHPDDRERVKDWFERTLSGESARNIEYRALTKDRGMKWFEANADAINWPGAERAELL